MACRMAPTTALQHFSTVEGSKIFGFSTPVFLAGSDFIRVKKDDKNPPFASNCYCGAAIACRMAPTTAFENFPTVQPSNIFGFSNRVFRCAILIFRVVIGREVLPAMPIRSFSQRRRLSRLSALPSLLPQIGASNGNVEFTAPRARAVAMAMQCDADCAQFARGAALGERAARASLPTRRLHTRRRHAAVAMRRAFSMIWACGPPMRGLSRGTTTPRRLLHPRSALLSSTPTRPPG